MPCCHKERKCARPLEDVSPSVHGSITHVKARASNKADVWLTGATPTDLSTTRYCYKVGPRESKKRVFFAIQIQYIFIHTYVQSMQGPTS
jgi:hypothetical protein